MAERRARPEGIIGLSAAVAALKLGRCTMQRVEVAAGAKVEVAKGEARRHKGRSKNARARGGARAGAKEEGSLRLRLSPNPR